MTIVFDNDPAVTAQHKREYKNTMNPTPERNKKLLLGAGGLAALSGLGYGAYKLHDKHDQEQ